MFSRFEGITIRPNVTFGTLLMKNLEKYEGYLKNGIPHGIGTYYWPNGDVYRGEIDNHQISGPGVITPGHGSRKAGVFANQKVLIFSFGNCC